MLQKNWVKDYLTFNKKDRIGAFVFIAVVAGCIFVPKLFSKNSGGFALKQDSVLVLAIDTLQQRQTAKKSFDRAQYENNSYQYESSSSSKSFTKGELFPFDPNTISLNEWLRLGLNEKTSKTILKYVSKGGKFYKPEDLQKIWGMPEGFYERVKDYVVISSIPKNYSSAYETKSYEREERKPASIDINAADTSAFDALYGIGSRLAWRIVNFREKLGGFYSIEQIGETYGLPDSTFQKIKPRLQISGDVRKLNVNTATKDELKVHPYIRWNLANAIVEYRNQHGTFQQLEELKNIVLIDEATFKKMVNYLEL